MTAATMMGNNRDIRSDVQDVLSMIEKFGSLLKAETAALQDADFRKVDTLQNDKRVYAREYHTLVTNLTSRKDDVVKLDLSLREKLIRARTDFTITLNDNLRALEAAKDGARRLANRILDVARQAVTEEQHTNYSAKGKQQAYTSSMRSLSVDQKL